MGFKIFEIIKGLVIREENSLTPKSLQLTPGGTSGTTTNVVSSQTVNRTITIPDKDETLTTASTVDVFSNKSIDLDDVTNSITNITDANIKALAGINATKIHDGSVDNTEFGFISGLTSPAVGTTQSQIISSKTIVVANNIITTAASGNLTATELNAALNELQLDIDSRIPSSEKGAANGVAPLNGSTKIDAIYLPSYVDDVLEYANLASFPVTGEFDKIYIALDTNKTYRWSGSIYVEVSPSDVNSVNGYMGIVNLSASDIPNVPSGNLSATDVQSALNELQSTIDSVSLTNLNPTLQKFLSGSGTYGLSYYFTVTSANATAGATYTNNGQTFTVTTTITAGMSLLVTSTGTPTSSGTLTKSAGTGDATITFSAYNAPKYIKVSIVGGGGGGGGASNTGVSTGASDGTNTVFGSNTANGGDSSPDSTGGNFSTGFGLVLVSAIGSDGGQLSLSANNGAFMGGGMGGPSFFGGAGRGGTVAPVSVAGLVGKANTGSGGGGGGGGVNFYSGSGGGSGGYLEFLVNSPAATYSYSVGGGGGGGVFVPGTGTNGGAGGSGVVIVEEYYT